MQSSEMSPPTGHKVRRVVAEKQHSFIAETSADAARRRGEDILGFPVVKGKTWNVTAIISPAEAKQIILAMPKQRPFYKNHAALFANLIRAGQFKPTHQGIAFDHDGLLLDGQHRLHACIDADMAIEVQVTFNMDRALFNSIDRGRIRSLTDDLITSARAVEYRESTMICAGAKILANLDRGVAPWVNYPRGTFGVVDVAEAMDAHPYLAEAGEYCSKNRLKLKGLGAGISTGFLARFMEINRSKALDFFNEIVTGELLVAGDPAYEMREQMRKPGSSSAHAKPRTMAALVRCWNAYAEGRKLSKVYTDTFPEISKGK